MKYVPTGQRQAQFRASLALVFPDGRTFYSEGVVEGNCFLNTVAAVVLGMTRYSIWNPSEKPLQN